jgi:hypothetical protein
LDSKFQLPQLGPLDPAQLSVVPKHVFVQFPAVQAVVALGWV